MRAFASALLAAVLLFPMLMFISARSGADAEEALMLSKAVAAERTGKSGEMTLVALKEIMQEVAGEKQPRDARSVRETQVEIARRMGNFEVFVEGEFAKRGVDADLWCGGLSGDEKGALLHAMIEEKGAKKCDGCWDLSDEMMLVGKAGAERVNVCAFAILVEPAAFGGRVLVGNSVLSLLYDEKGTVLAPLDARGVEMVAVGEASIGISIYDRKTGAGTVQNIAQGEGIAY